MPRLRGYEQTAGSVEFRVKLSRWNPRQNETVKFKEVNWYWNQVLDKIWVPIEYDAIRISSSVGLFLVWKNLPGICLKVLGWYKSCWQCDDELGSCIWPLADPDDSERLIRWWLGQKFIVQILLAYLQTQQWLNGELIIRYLQLKIIFIIDSAW